MSASTQTCTHTASPLLSLPPELLLYLGLQLPPSALHALSQTCQALHDLLSSDVPVWREVLTTHHLSLPSRPPSTLTWPALGHLVAHDPYLPPHPADALHPAIEALYLPPSAIPHSSSLLLGDGRPLSKAPATLYALATCPSVKTLTVVVPHGAGLEPKRETVHNDLGVTVGDVVDALCGLLLLAWWNEMNDESVSVSSFSSCKYRAGDKTPEAVFA